MPAGAYLKVNPVNPHYFLETTTGKPMILVGYGGVAPDTLSNDDSSWISEMKHCGLHYGRVWIFTPWAGARAIRPWRRSHTPDAYIGGRGICCVSFSWRERDTRFAVGEIPGRMVESAYRTAHGEKRRRVRRHPASLRGSGLTRLDAPRRTNEIDECSIDNTAHTDGCY